MVNIEIDGKPVQVEPGSMVIEAADAANIYIPRFCYHKKLSIAANCRMCLVEVEKAPKPLPACATPVNEGMKVFTQTAKTLQAQKTVMEFLLINHPLDCPICDQGGECELQDLSMGFGSDSSSYTESKRAVDDDNLGSLIASDMTRCIHCTRCVRFGQEIAGVRELGATGRGGHMEITTYVKQTLSSELSGNIIDLCPVGALTSKPYRFTARAWELKQHATIAPHDAVGSHIYVHSRRDKVMRVVPRENEALNENWLSDRDRFSYSGLYHDDRALSPMIKENGEWQIVDWKTAFEKITENLPNLLAKEGASQLAGLISPSSTLEELYLFQKLIRALGSANVDHRIHQIDFADDDNLPTTLGFKNGIAEIESLESILLVGSNIHREQPIIGHRIRQASLQDANVFALNVMEYDYHFPVTKHLVSQPSQMLVRLCELAKYTAEQFNAVIPDTLRTVLNSVVVSEEITAFAQSFFQGEQRAIFLGAMAQNLPNASLIRAACAFIAEISNTSIGYLTEGANSQGAFIAGALPHRTTCFENVNEKGLHAKAMFEENKKAYFLFGLELDDLINPGVAKEALKQADFVVSFSAYHSDALFEMADVILPIVPFTETSGTYINLHGDWQSFKACVSPTHGSRPGWKVLRVLGNLLNLSGFDYLESETICDEIAKLHRQVEQTTYRQQTQLTISPVKTGLQLLTQWPIYRIDALTRRSDDLQKSVANENCHLYVNQKTAEQYGISQAQKVKVKTSDGEFTIPVTLDETLSDECVLIPASYAVTRHLTDSFTNLTVEVSHD